MKSEVLEPGSVVRDVKPLANGGVSYTRILRSDDGSETIQHSEQIEFDRPRRVVTSAESASMVDGQVTITRFESLYEEMPTGTRVTLQFDMQLPDRMKRSARESTHRTATENAERTLARVAEAFQAQPR